MCGDISFTLSYIKILAQSGAKVRFPSGLPLAMSRPQPLGNIHAPLLCVISRARRNLKSGRDRTKLWHTRQDIGITQNESGRRVGVSRSAVAQS